MIVLDDIDNSKHSALVATIGFFDGVHSGHRFLLKQVCDQAKARQLSSAVITFREHPQMVMHPEFRPELLCSFSEKIDKLSQTQIDYCIPLHFTKALSELSAKIFMQEFLHKKLNVDTLVIGYDHRFGHNRSDNFESYARYGQEMGMNVIQAKEWDQGYASSSIIRALLKKGQVQQASQLLTYNYSLTGIVTEGFKIGRTIGFPTANLQVNEPLKVIPAVGVYAAYVYVLGNRYRSMLYIGNRPTLDNGTHITVEANLFNFDQEIYGETMTIEFLAFTRGDEKFESLDRLKQQIQTDKETIQQFFATYNKD